ncbi:MAG: leucine-rich repeat domain-containing protein, partial [Ureaplasma sp.]|nr:leucine-rich repeat domain-containing protein [Ureaplasma sp.]
LDYYSFNIDKNQPSSPYYEINNGKIYIKNLSYASYSATSIFYFYMEGNFLMSLTSSGSTLSTIVLPSTVTGINYHTFDNNKNIRTVDFSFSGITTLPNSMFLGCTNLKTVSMGNKITNMGSNTFAGDTSLQSVMLSPKLTIIENSAFNGCSSLMGVKIPDSVTTISYNAFTNCSSLYEINFGTGLTTIQNSAFNGCSSLTRLTLPDKITTINYDAFLNCTSLLSIEIPDSINFIAPNAFSGCSKLKIYVKNQTTRNKILGFNLSGISPDNIIVGSPN